MSNTETVPATGTHLNALPRKNYKMIDALGHQLRVYDEGPADAPDPGHVPRSPHNSLEFRFNVPALVRAGYRVVIPEHLGAGGSDRPEERRAVLGPPRLRARPVGRRRPGHRHLLCRRRRPRKPPRCGCLPP
ncbi:hypothetical protein [Streptomyces sp. KL116D]|uniref:hypothetical protein n=1 Tax=Streptomyces sp. KL116D TaxID=3045152 RepID=UPI003558A017